MMTKLYWSWQIRVVLRRFLGVDKKQLIFSLIIDSRQQRKTHTLLFFHRQKRAELTTNQSHNPNQLQGLI